MLLNYSLRLISNPLVVDIKTRNILIIIFSLIAFIALLYFICSIVYGEIFFRLTCLNRKEAKKNKENKQKEQHENWLNKQKLEELVIISEDIYALHGYFLNNNSDNKLAILVHGIHRDYLSLEKQAKMFSRLHYDILLINLRAHANSEGKLITMGVKESDDLRRWINLMLKKNENYKIVLYGISLGAHIVARASENLGDNIKGIVFDCGFFNLKDQLTFHISKSMRLHSSHWIAFNGLRHTKLYHHLTLKSDLTNCLKNSKFPFLFIHGDADSYIPLSEHKRAIASMNKDVFMMSKIFPGSKHTRSIHDHEEKYFELLKQFLDKVVK